MKNFQILAFTHKNLPLELIGKLHLSDEQEKAVLAKLVDAFELKELMYLSTCNRVEFLMVKEDASPYVCPFKFVNTFLSLDKEQAGQIALSAQNYTGDVAVKHIFEVASSIDSLVVGEREIITQVRNSFEKSRKMELSGDFIRLVIRKTIEVAKQIYTETNIAKNPVSVVFLAYQRLKEMNVSDDARFLVIGAGQTNRSMAKFLQKHKFTNFAVFNRTLSKAKELANELGSDQYFGIEELSKYNEGFDVLITCTGASETLITKEIYSSLLNGEKSKKIIIDLAIPYDIDTDIPNMFNTAFISIEELKKVAEENLKKRESELDSCNKIILDNLNEFKSIAKERKVEIAMSKVPVTVKEIKERAMSEVFHKELESLDENSKETLEKILSYFEKKYISVPMKMAKEILLETEIEHHKKNG